jgi:proline dehydrogenase
MSVMGDSKSLLLNPDRNVLLRWFLKKTFYKHFCAGENAAEVKEVTKSLRDMGYKGVMLCYAKEVVLDEKAARELEESGGKASEAIIQNEILPWKKGTLNTVAMAEPGDFIALK